MWINYRKPDEVAQASERYLHKTHSSDIIPPNMDCGGKGRTLEEMIEALHEIFEGDHVEVEAVEEIMHS